LYIPSPQTPELAKNHPILIFVYGGAFISGDKIVREMLRGIVCSNIGYFFSEKMGFETIVMDYL
jgi:acetyl esterase/lipase